MSAAADCIGSSGETEMTVLVIRVSIGVEVLFSSALRTLPALRRSLLDIIPRHLVLFHYGKCGKPTLDDEVIDFLDRVAPAHRKLLSSSCNLLLIP